MRRCLAILSLAVVAWAAALPAGAAVPPARRDHEEVVRALRAAPKAPGGKLRPLNVLLVANRKDHGAHEHDYPRWMERWKVLLGGKGAVPPTLYGLTADLPSRTKPGAARVTVETAVDWPTPEQLRRADVVVAFMGTGGVWNEARLRDLRSLLDRGAGFVALHAAVIAEKPHARPLADLLGLAWENGTTLFRHGPLDLKITRPDHPITRGLPERIHFEDETYWPLVGDASRVEVLATADEPMPGTGKLTPQPMFWTHTVGKGRVFNSILGHYTWTFDDPYFRALVLRGIAWAAGESPYRFDPVVLAGARTTTEKPEVAKTAPVTPLAPDAADPNLLLWLDASDGATLTTTADGRVSAWSSKAGPGGKLTGAGSQQPALAAQALGGKPAVRFDGTDDVLRNPAFRQTLGEWTVALVVTPRSNAGLFRALLAGNRSGQDDFQTGFNIDLGSGGTSTFSSLNLEGVKGGGATNLRTASAPFGGGQVLIVGVGGGTARLWVNGEQEEARGAGDAATVMEELRLGGRFYLGQERGYFHGDISEVLLYRGQLSEGQRVGLAAHLMRKYGPDIQPPAAVVLDPWDYLPSYDWGSTRRPLAVLDEAVARAGSDRRLRRSLETRFIELLADPANTAASRDFACRRLAIIGSEASVPALAGLLTDPALAPMACFALERIPGREAERALLEALGRVTGSRRLEVIQALGARRSAAAVPELAGLLAGPDLTLRQAAVTALGSIGSPAAVTVLTDALDRGPDGGVAAALLRAAEREGAQQIYERLARPNVPAAQRNAALRALVALRGAGAAPLLLEQLRAPEAATRAGALLLIRDLPGRESTLAVAEGLKGLRPEVQAQATTVLADRGDAAAAPAVRALLKSEAKEVRLAALRALGRLGDPSDLPALLAAAAGEDRETAAAARDSLATLPGAAADAALLEAAGRGEAGPRAAAVEALGRRGSTAATPRLLGMARGQEPALRVAALRALAETATVAEVPALVELLVSTKDDGEVQAAEKALSTLHARLAEKDRWAEALLARVDAAQPERRAALLRALALHGGPRALQAVRSALSHPDPDLQDEALALLTDWETPDAADVLLDLSKSSDNPTHRVLALRGYIRMAGLPGLTDARRLEMAREALRRAGRDDERRLALAVLAGVPRVEALQTALPFVEQEGLAEEAAAALVGISRKLLPAHGGAVREAMDRVSRSVKNEDLLRQAAEVRARAEQAEKN